MSRVRSFLLGAGAALLALPAASAQADGWVVPCAKRKQEVVRTHGSVVWHKNGSLYGCVAGYTDASASSEVEPVFFDPSYTPTPARRLGPWSPGSKIVFDGVEATWIYRKTLKSGAQVDRVYAIDVNVGRAWLRGALPALDPADRTVVDLKLGQNFATWITARGTLMAAAQGGFGTPGVQEAFDLELVGAGTAGSAGLVEALTPREDSRMLIGTFPSLANQTTSTLRLKRLSDADMQNEQCIGSYRWEVTVKPRADAPRVGGIWRAAYFPHDIYCEG